MARAQSAMANNPDYKKSSVNDPNRELDAGENGELGSSGDMGATDSQVGTVGSPLDENGGTPDSTSSGTKK